MGCVGEIEVMAKGKMCGRSSRVCGCPGAMCGGMLCGGMARVGEWRVSRDNAAQLGVTRSGM